MPQSHFQLFQNNQHITSRVATMKFHNSVLDLIGNTPLVKLNRLVTPGMATVLAKLEMYNPAGSVKDRMAYNMVRHAEEQGLIKRGATLVESTSGNTGLGLAMVAAVRGYNCICTMPDKMSKEKIDMLKAYGAKVIITRTDLDHDHPDSYVKVAKRIARATPGSFYTDQYYNMSNPEAHYLTTGPEIWEACEGNIDALVGGIGTGGTISGAAKYLREKSAEVGRELRVVCPDPIGSIYFDTFNQREVRQPGIYRVEGIGHDFMVGTLDFSVVDEVMEVSDQDSFITARKLARQEGIFVGGSCGTAVFGALKVAAELGEGKTVVVILPDSGDRYLSKYYSDEWMCDMGYNTSVALPGCVLDVLKYNHKDIIFADPDETLSAVSQRMAEYGVSQMPIKIPNASPLMIHEVDLLQGMLNGECTPDSFVVDIAKPLNGQVAVDDSLEHVQRVFESDNVVVVMKDGEMIGIISKLDLVLYMSHRISDISGNLIK